MSKNPKPIPREYIPRRRTVPSYVVDGKVQDFPPRVPEKLFSDKNDTSDFVNPKRTAAKYYWNKDKERDVPLPDEPMTETRSIA